MSDGRARAVLFDVDGTLALRRTGGRNWFDWSRVGEDLPNPPVVELARMVIAAQRYGGPELLVISGRDAVCEEQTATWLRDLDIFYTKLHMRPQGDNRPDQVVKQEIYARDIAPWWDIVWVADDRDKVVRMWRKLGLTCLQVAEGNF